MEGAGLRVGLGDSEEWTMAGGGLELDGLVRALRPREPAEPALGLGWTRAVVR